MRSEAVQPCCSICATAEVKLRASYHCQSNFSRGLSPEVDPVCVTKQCKLDASDAFFSDFITSINFQTALDNSEVISL